MKSETFNTFWKEHLPELAKLIKALIPEIGDEYRASDDFQDHTPAMAITISVNADCSEWSYQTGDNSYTGGCYRHPFWGVGTIYRDSKPMDLANELVESLAEIIEWE